MNAAPQPHARGGSSRIAARQRIGVLGTFLPPNNLTLGLEPARTCRAGGIFAAIDRSSAS